MVTSVWELERVSATEPWDSRRFLVTVVADPSSLSVRELKHQMPNLFGLVVSFETTFHVDLAAILSTMTLRQAKKSLIPQLKGSLRTVWFGILPPESRKRPRDPRPNCPVPRCQTATLGSHFLRREGCQDHFALITLEVFCARRSCWKRVLKRRKILSARLTCTSLRTNTFSACSRNKRSLALKSLPTENSAAAIS